MAKFRCSSTVFVLLLTLCLSACHVAPRIAIQYREPAPLDGIPCIGKIGGPRDALREMRDDALLQSAVAATGKGQICTGQVYETTKPITVYRLWSSENPLTRFGRWWALQPPAGSREDYRKEYAICPEWNSLSRISSCQIKVGTHVVIGPGQSATCERGISYGKSAANQVFIPNDARKNEILVEKCYDAAFPH